MANPMLSVLLLFSSSLLLCRAQYSPNPGYNSNYYNPGYNMNGYRQYNGNSYYNGNNGYSSYYTNNGYNSFNGYVPSNNYDNSPPRQASPTAPTYSWGGAPFQTPVSGTFLNSRGSQTCGCESTWKPVCVNGVTFANSCDALCLGMPEENIGQCGAPIKIQMFWQRYTIGHDCNCHKNRQPVCAEAVTYENSCVALCRGAKNYIVGECDPTYWGPNLKQDNGYGGSKGDLVPVVFVGGCANTEYGCCPNGKPAAGWYGQGCPEEANDPPAIPPPTPPPPSPARNCATTMFGCCPDGNAASGPVRGMGCVVTPPPTPAENCATTVFGCCPDGYPAKGPVKGMGCIGDETLSANALASSWPAATSYPMSTGSAFPASSSFLPSSSSSSLPSSMSSWPSSMSTSWPSSNPVTVGYSTPSAGSSFFTRSNSRQTTSAWPISLGR